MAVLDPPMHSPCQAWSGFPRPTHPLTVTPFIVHETGMGVPDCSYENTSKTFIYNFTAILGGILKISVFPRRRLIIDQMNKV